MAMSSGDALGNMALGGIIKERRESMGMTQKELAAAVGNCSPKTISLYEKGKCPTEVETYFSLAEALHLTPNDLAPKRLMENAESGMSDYARLNTGNQRIVDQLIIGVLKLQNENAESPANDGDDEHNGDEDADDGDTEYSGADAGTDGGEVEG